jgi:YfiH family protein
MIADIAELPQPNEAFAWVQASAGTALVCRPLLDVAPHLFTTRPWSLGSPENGEAAPAWREIAGALRCDPDRLVRLRQVHGTRVVVARCPTSAQEEADIVVSNDPDLGLTVRAADCVPLLVADCRTGAVAAAHAGWRGLAAGVPGAVVAAMKRAFGSAPRDLVAAAGPSIGACCYEVGGEVRQRFAQGGFGEAALDAWFSAHPAVWARNPPMPGLNASGGRDRWFFDGWAAARDQLIAAGLDRGRIFVAELCTASHPTALCSYRREAAAAGRLVGAIRSRSPRP